MEIKIMRTENSEKNEPHKCVLDLSQRSYLRRSNKHVTLQSSSIYYAWKNIRKHCKTRN